jgi:hypothetical protein
MARWSCCLPKQRVSTVSSMRMALILSVKFSVFSTEYVAIVLNTNSVWSYSFLPHLLDFLQWVSCHTFVCTVLSVRTDSSGRFIGRDSSTSLNGFQTEIMDWPTPFKPDIRLREIILKSFEIQNLNPLST